MNYARRQLYFLFFSRKLYATCARFTLRQKGHFVNFVPGNSEVYICLSQKSFFFYFCFINILPFLQLKDFQHRFFKDFLKLALWCAQIFGKVKSSNSWIVCKYSWKDNEDSSSLYYIEWWQNIFTSPHFKNFWGSTSSTEIFNETSENLWIKLQKACWWSARYVDW